MATHLFWRDPSAGLFGAYGHYVHADALDGKDFFAGAVEGALFLGRFTLEGVVGIEGGEADLGAGGSVDVGTRFFDAASLAYYPTDNFKLSVGHSYFFGGHTVSFGAEWGFAVASGTMGALFADGSIGERGYDAIRGGLRFYFGRHEKTQIRRHREDDPSSAPILGTVSRVCVAKSLTNSCAPPPPLSHSRHSRRAVGSRSPTDSLHRANDWPEASLRRNSEAYSEIFTAELPSAPLRAQSELCDIGDER